MWTLLEADALAVRSLRGTADDPSAVRAITVRFSGPTILSEYFQRDMAVTGWDIIELRTEGDSAVISMEWLETSNDEALRGLSSRLRTIADRYGVVYEGWSLPAVIPKE